MRGLPYYGTVDYRQTQLDTYKRINDIKCIPWRPLTIVKCIAWHVRSGEQYMPNRERSGSATTKTNSNFTKIPSNQHVKAFPMSKFNSETSFLYQLFKGNSNFIVLKPCKVIDLSIFMIFIIIYKLYILHKVTFD